MAQIIIGKIWVCLGLSLPEPGACLQLTGTGVAEWKSQGKKTYDRVQIRVINTGDAGIL